jgi:DNA-binding CsgD family transcriptional regulator
MAARQRQGLHFHIDGRDALLLRYPIDSGPGPQLTDAERQVAFRALNGNSNAEIARRRNTSVRTVANQLQAVFRKLRIGSRTELGRVLPQYESGRLS